MVHSTHDNAVPNFVHHQMIHRLACQEAEQVLHTKLLQKACIILVTHKLGGNYQRLPSHLFLWITFLRILRHVCGVQFFCCTISLKICLIHSFVSLSKFLDGLCPDTTAVTSFATFESIDDFLNLFCRELWNFLEVLNLGIPRFVVRFVLHFSLRFLSLFPRRHRTVLFRSPLQPLPLSCFLHRRRIVLHRTLQKRQRFFS